MKNALLFTIIILFVCFTSCEQEDKPEGGAIVKTHSGPTQVTAREDGILLVNVSGKDVEKFRKDGFVRYSSLGAKHDGETCDMDAIAATHAFANKHKLTVKADDDVTYYIGGKARTAIIQTNTEFGNAKFIIDDTNVEDRKVQIFSVESILLPFEIDGISTLQRNQEKIDVSLPANCLITVTDTNVRRYIRYGLNQNNGKPQTDIFYVDKKGNIDMNAPVIWDFEQITRMSALPVDENVLSISGGEFTSIANQEESEYNYFARGFCISRSNVVIDGLVHKITGEGDQGAPYRGFLSISDCSGVTVKNTILTGHKTYKTIGSAGKPVPMGSYDITVNRAINVSFINCSQTNDINDITYWGIMGSNFSKNLLLDNCNFSRFDAHMGVANATIRNSTLGHMGINAIGTGTLLVENSTLNGWSMINLRSDYGSTWEGDFIIRDCVFVPGGGRVANPGLINGYYTGQHDFGYICYMPHTITIENLLIDDANHPEDYEGPAIFNDFNTQFVNEEYVQVYPYVITEKVVLDNVTTTSGMDLRISDNPFMFNDVDVVVKN